MTTSATLRRDFSETVHQPAAAKGLAIVRLTLGAMFLSVFFENLGKGLYTPNGYAGLISTTSRRATRRQRGRRSWGLRRVMQRWRPRCKP